MARKVQKVLNLEIVAGKAQPAPPLWPMLWANWVNIGEFVKEFNGKTAEFQQKFAWADVKMKATLTIYNDRSFGVEIGHPVSSSLILWKLKLKKWSWEPNKIKVWTITRADLEEIANLKLEDFNAKDLDWAVKVLEWTCKNMWIEVK